MTIEVDEITAKRIEEICRKYRCTKEEAIRAIVSSFFRNAVPRQKEMTKGEKYLQARLELIRRNSTYGMLKGDEDEEN